MEKCEIGKTVVISSSPVMSLVQITHSVLTPFRDIFSIYIFKELAG